MGIGNAELFDGTDFLADVGEGRGTRTVFTDE